MTSVGVDLVADLPPLVEPGVHRRQQLGPHPAVLGQVDPAAGLDDAVVELVEQRAQPGGADGDVEGERPARRSGTTAGPGCPARSA